MALLRLGLRLQVLVRLEASLLLTARLRCRATLLLLLVLSLRAPTWPLAPNFLRVLRVVLALRALVALVVLLALMVLLVLTITPGPITTHEATICRAPTLFLVPRMPLAWIMLLEPTSAVPPFLPLALEVICRLSVVELSTPA